LTQNKATVRFPIFSEPKEILLSPLRSQENPEYCLLDTGTVLNLLSSLESFFNRLNKKQLNLAIPKKTIEEVTEHLNISYNKKRKLEGRVNVA